MKTFIAKVGRGLCFKVVIESLNLLSRNLPLCLPLVSSCLHSQQALWTDQLSHLLGRGEVEKLDTKLRSLAVAGLDSLQLSSHQFCPDMEGEVARLADSVVRELLHVFT